ncbi:nuclease-related domain-containing protein [Allobacillus sp. GCM10007491]|uniref:NERD domain-containing protein n=1 Tax=Allobacillus saliphilus TaxID=2912308 RepID=A0A941CWW0_9BACI|nr:nuclease-related domain-containing protein [Allobacillus saliphilus]MBR7554131.1 NERD domain-containing protein [Allobacillus saliphilus]
MLIKNHEVPLALLKLASIKRRLPTTHPKYQKIFNDWALYNAGYRGELALDYYLHRFNQPENYMLHSLRLHHKQTFQIDTLILHPNFFLLIEVKNLSGKVNFDHGFGLMTRENNGHVQSFQDPIIQAENQAFLLQNWLIDFGISGVPVESLVVFVNNHVHLTRSDDQHVDPRIIHANKLADTYNQLHQKYPKNLLPTQKLRVIGQKMMQENKPLQANPFQKYQLTRTAIQPGVICPICDFAPMKRYHGYWKCDSCGHSSSFAHIDALKDFYLLFNDQITNREARWFFQIDSRKIARNLLIKLPMVGKNKGASYQLDFNIERDFTYLLSTKEKDQAGYSLVQ